MSHTATRQQTCQCHGTPLSRLPRDHEPVVADGLVYDWFNPSGVPVTPPPGGWEPEVSRAEALAQPCPTCSVAAADECDPSVYRFFLLPLAVRGIGRVHTGRYKAAVAAKKAEKEGL